MTDPKDFDLIAADQDQTKGKPPKKTGQKVSLSNGALELLATLADEGYLFWFRDHMLFSDSISYNFIDPKTAVTRAEVPFIVNRVLVHRLIDLNLIGRLSSKGIATLEASLDAPALARCGN